MSRPRAKAAKATLDFFLKSTRGRADWPRALRALTLFMVRGHAPRFFAQHKLQRVLDAALKALASVPRALPMTLSAIDGMSRVDACWLEWAAGAKPSTPPVEEARAFVALTQNREGLLWAWVMGELLAQAGVDARVELPERAFAESADEEALYFRSHRVLLASRYLSVPIDPSKFAEEAKALGLAVAPLGVTGDLDLLAEAAFCLQALGADAEPALALLEAGVAERGQVGKETGYSGAHVAAAALVALAGSVDRTR